MTHELWIFDKILYDFKKKILGSLNKGKASEIPGDLKQYHHCPYFAYISDFFFRKRFLGKSSNPGHGNLVLITSTVQVELSKLV